MGLLVLVRLCVKILFVVGIFINLMKIWIEYFLKEFWINLGCFLFLEFFLVFYGRLFIFVLVFIVVLLFDILLVRRI